jgi:hypothetical protein
VAARSAREADPLFGSGSKQRAWRSASGRKSRDLGSYLAAETWLRARPQRTVPMSAQEGEMSRDLGCGESYPYCRGFKFGLRLVLVTARVLESIDQRGDWGFSRPMSAELS